MRFNADHNHKLIITAFAVVFSTMSMVYAIGGGTGRSGDAKGSVRPPKEKFKKGDGFKSMFKNLTNMGRSSAAQSAPVREPRKPVEVRKQNFTMSTVENQANKTRVKFHGHAAFEIVTPKGAVLMIDPWLRNPKNPYVKKKQDPLLNVKKLDYILITHGHFDHVGDAITLAKKTGAKLVTNFELGKNMVNVLGYPAKQIGFDTMMNIGGEIEIANGEVTVAMVPAVHSSGLDVKHAKEGEPSVVYGGCSAGFVLLIKNGPSIYHTGDTAYYKDMSLIGDNFAPDIALINIGGHFGMEPYMAANAAYSVRAGLVIPQHYGTFPILTKNPQSFFKDLERLKIAHMELNPGEEIVYEGKNKK